MTVAAKSQSGRQKLSTITPLPHTLLCQMEQFSKQTNKQIYFNVLRTFQQPNKLPIVIAIALVHPFYFSPFDNRLSNKKPSTWLMLQLSKLLPEMFQLHQKSTVTMICCPVVLFFPLLQTNSICRDNIEFVKSLDKLCPSSNLPVLVQLVQFKQICSNFPSLLWKVRRTGQP